MRDKGRTEEVIKVSDEVAVMMDSRKGTAEGEGREERQRMEKERKKDSRDVKWERIECIDRKRRREKGREGEGKGKTGRKETGREGKAVNGKEK